MTDAVFEPVSMQIELLAEDYADFVAYVYKRPALRRRRMRSHVRFAILMIVVLLAYLIWQAWAAQSVDWRRIAAVYFQGLAVGLGILAVLAWSYEFVLPGLVKANTRRLLRRPAHAALLGRHQIEFDPSGIRDTTATASGHIAWHEVRRAEETPMHFYVILGEQQGVVIPKRNQSQAVLEAVRAQLQTYVADTQLRPSLST